VTPIDVSTLPDDAATLKTLLQRTIVERDAVVVERDALLARAVQAESERDALRHELTLRLKALYGPRTEKLDPAQLELFIDRVEAARRESAAQSEPIRVEAHDRRRRGRKPLPADLPRERVVHDLSEEEKACPCCGEPRLAIAQTTREVLDVIPAQVKVIEHVRPVYLCPTCEGVPAKAPAPKLPLRKSYAGAGLLAMIAVSKFADHAPLYRQEGMLARSGVDLSRSTLCGWLGEGARLVQPLAGLMRTAILQSKVIQTDDTTVPTLGLVKGRAKQARIWSYVGDEAHRYVVYEFTATREGKWPQAWLGGYAGDLQSDAYAGYDALGVTGAVRLVGCWAHARRKFYDARTLAPGFCVAVLSDIGTLYGIEADLRGRPPDERRAVRRDRAGPVMERLLDRLRAGRPEQLPKSPVSQAIGYVLERERCFTRYLDEGHLEIDNNACERSLRAVAIGRRNWLFAGSGFGGENAAIWFSLIGSARLHEVEPWRYLRDMLTRLPLLGEKPGAEALRELLPDHWLAAHPDARLPLNR
jgi:transposase